MSDAERFVDDRAETEQERLEEHVANPEAFDKLGDPAIGRVNPGRCHVCLAWTAYPYSEQSRMICPDCHELTDAQRDRVRDRVREALQPVWEADQP